MKIKPDNVFVFRMIIIATLGNFLIGSILEELGYSVATFLFGEVIAAGFVSFYWYKRLINDPEI